jgi:3-isopropylmalate dehydrogenase
VLFGSVGSGPEFESIPIEIRRRDNIIRVRREMGLFANLRPLKSIAALADVSSLRPEVTRDVDIFMVRELSGGLYTGQPRGTETLPDGQRRAFNTQAFTTHEIRRIARVAFEIARDRSKRLTCVDKSNALESGMLWREDVKALREAQYPDIALNNIYVDTCALALMQNPRQFDVMLLDNMFGDILSDEASVIVGSVMMLPSASLGARGADGRLPALYEPLHEPAHHIAGQNKANPLGAIRCLALALDFSFGRKDDARLLEQAIGAALDSGARTLDIAAGKPAISTAAMGDAVLAALDRLAT